MIIVISAIVFAATTSGLHILPCEPGYPGPLGCDQFVANGGQLGAGLDAGVGQVSGGGQVAGGGLIDVFSQFENIGQSPGSLAMDPAFWDNPSLQQADLVDPTQFVEPMPQFVDPTAQFVDPNLQFIDPTQIVEPLFDGGIAPVQLDQTSRPIPLDVEFVGGNVGTAPAYPKGSKSNIIKSYPKSFLKKILLKLILKGYLKKDMHSVYPKGYAKKKILGGYLKGRSTYPNMYARNPSMFGKSYYKKSKGYGIPRVYRKQKYLVGYGGYPKIGLKRKMGHLGKHGRSYSKGYPKLYISKYI